MPADDRFSNALSAGESFGLLRALNTTRPNIRGHGSVRIVGRYFAKANITGVKWLPKRLYEYVVRLTISQRKHDVCKVYYRRCPGGHAPHGAPANELFT